MTWLSADFETLANNEEYTYVWAWAHYNIKTNFFNCGSNISNFFEDIYINYQHENEIVLYFHNLKFDGSFIINYLYKLGYREKETRVKNNEGLFYSTLISSLGQWYSIEFFYKTLKIKVLNSLNLLPFSVKKVAEMLKLEVKKGEINYNLYRDENHTLTEEEKEYIYNDVFIIAKALEETFFSKNFLKMTVGSNALRYAKDTTENYKTLFPQLSKQEHLFIKQAYRGGFTYINGGEEMEYIGDGCVFDYNSMYPSMMKLKPLPYGRPKIFFPLSLKDLNKISNKLYVLSFFCTFKLRPGAIPTFLNKNPLIGKEGEYLEESTIKSRIYMTNIDFYHFKKNYYINDFKIELVYYFESKTGVFNEYIDKWAKEKIDGEKEKNQPKKLLAKLMLNSLTGKFATSELANRKLTYLYEEVLKFKEVQGNKTTEYIPLTTFITAWSRNELFNVIYENKENFLYSDTDSVHLKCKKEDAKINNQHPTDFGNWKFEYSFNKARYIKRKCYIEENEKEKIVKCAGLSERYHNKLNFENFKVGTTLPVLRLKQVKGGQVLVKSLYKI